MKYFTIFISLMLFCGPVMARGSGWMLGPNHVDGPLMWAILPGAAAIAWAQAKIGHWLHVRNGCTGKYYMSGGLALFWIIVVFPCVLNIAQYVFFN